MCVILFDLSASKTCSQRRERETFIYVCVRCLAQDWVWDTCPASHEVDAVTVVAKCH